MIPEGEGPQVKQAQRCVRNLCVVVTCCQDSIVVVDGYNTACLPHVAAPHKP
jgi:hypothetical protein